VNLVTDVVGLCVRRDHILVTKATK